MLNSLCLPQGTYNIVADLEITFGGKDIHNNLELYSSCTKYHLKCNSKISLESVITLNNLLYLDNKTRTEELWDTKKEGLSDCPNKFKQMKEEIPLRIGRQ